MNSLEKRVAKYFGRKYCVITGSGTTSMNLFFRAIPNKGTVMFPAITCIQAINHNLLGANSLFKLNPIHFEWQGNIE